MADQHPYGKKTDWWRCARCRRWFLVTEPTHACYWQGNVGVNSDAPRTFRELDEQINEEIRRELGAASIGSTKSTEGNHE